MILSSFVFVVMVAFLVLLERKLLRGVQLRTRPMVVGIFGIVQTVVDGVKLFSKGIYMLKVSGIIFLLIALSVSTASFLLGVIFLLVLMMYCFLISVYDSANYYSILGGLRAVIVILAFDIVFYLLFLVDLSLLVLILLTFVLSSECRRTPVDLVEGESELVSGFNTEYSGAMFVFYFLGEYVIIITLFVLILSLHTTVIMLVMLRFVIFWRASYPRLKYNELLAIF